MDKEFLQYLGGFGIVEIDIGCNEPISWGYPIIKTIPQDTWNKIKLTYKMHRTNQGYLDGQYFVITKTLTRKEAIEKYGLLTNEIRGPNGGFKSAKFGDKQFYSKYLKG